MVEIARLLCNILFQIDRVTFEMTINKLNEYFEEAEKGSCSTYCEGCFACLTAYLIYICKETHYEKVMSDFINCCVCKHL